MWKQEDREEYARQWRLRVRQPIELLGSVLHGGLLLGATLLVVIVGVSAQGQELFRRLLEADTQPNVEEGVAVAAAVLLSGLLHFTYRRFLPNLGTDREHDSAAARVVGATGLAAIAAAPWLACLVSAHQMRQGLIKSREALSGAISPDMPTSLQEQAAAIITMADRIYLRSWYAILVLLGLGLITVALLWLMPRRRWPWLRRGAASIFNIAAGTIVLVLGLGAAWLDNSLVGLYQWMGTLAAGLVAAIGFFALALFFGWVARGIGFAAYFALILLVAATALVVQAKNNLFGAQSAAVDKPNEPNQPLAYDCAVRSWVAARMHARQNQPPVQPFDCAGSLASASASNQRIPLLILSAQGGGMYAAMASSLFMARLQQANPQFAKSLFAISSVSGGSIGSALFNALISPGGCQASAGSGPVSKPEFEQQIPNMLLMKSHLAPVVGNLLPDIFKKFTSPFGAHRDRADALTESLLAECGSLNQLYAGSWNPQSNRPALVLNTTWMGNGHRVAFAPFALNRIGDGTLWSFEEIYSGLEPLQGTRKFTPTIADAAVASARFPGILPPLSLTVRVRGDDGKQAIHSHSFGDGGYADASGVTTALEMLEAVQDNEDLKSVVSPQLIVLTFDYKKVTPMTSDGTTFVDTLAPILALLGVRENLAGKAIARAEKFQPTGSTAKVVRVSIDPERYGLVLGFQLSRISYEVLSLLVGRPEWCPVNGKVGDNPILKNSCAARDVLNNING